MELENKVVLVTGGGSGIGLGVAQAMAQEKCRVLICGRSAQTLETARSTFPIAANIRTASCDVADRGSITATVDALQQDWGTPEVVVHCAGINVPKRMLDNLDPEDFERVLSVNATGAFNLMHAVVPGMKAHGGGLIVNIVSVAGRRALTLAGLPYSAAKFAQRAIGDFVNLEHAEKSGIRVTNIFPGEVNTPIVDRRLVVPSAEQRARMLQPEDVAACVVTIAKLPPRALVSELVIVPPYQAGV